MPLPARGVYKALYLVKGWPALVAIDSRGNARKHLKIKNPDDEPQLKHALEELLDMIDPVPRLRLVEPEKPIGWPYDPDAPRPVFSRAPQQRTPRR